MSSKKLFPNGEAAPEGSVGRHGNWQTFGIVLALSGLAAVVGFVTLLFMVREIATLREQQMALQKDLRDQQTALMREIRDQHTVFQTDQREHQTAFQEDLREELQVYLKDQVLQMQLKQEKEAEDKGPAGSTDDWRRDDSATFWKSAEVHRRSKRNSESKTVLILGKRSELGCLSGPPASDGPPQVTTPAAPTAPPQVTTPAAPTAPPQVTTPAAPTGPPQVTTPAATTAPPQVTTPAAPTAPPADTDCAAFKAAGHTTSGVYTLGSPLSGVEVYCDMDTAEGGWTVIQRRLDGSVPFDRTWEEYKHGFGNKNGEYWLGNENIHLLTNQKDYRLRIELMGWDMQTRYAEYDTFRVAAASDQYRLTVSGYSGTAGDQDSMAHNNGMMFSTKDRDNDARSGGDCSQPSGHAGWWFASCGWSYLNGRYLGNCGYFCRISEGVVWYHWRGYSYSLKSVSMKIRPRLSHLLY
ncbi:Fibrinogen- domains (FReDs) [Branchiostoma belcheri]|nr:Fibrinogen- domains (FReDs) [Branchiostoma belcheri]